MATTLRVGKISRNRIAIVCSAAFLIATTIGFGAVNLESVSLITVGRAIALSTTVISLALYISKGTIHRSAFFGVWVFIVYFLYAILNSIALVGNMYLISEYVVSVTVITMGIVIFSITSSESIQNGAAAILNKFFWAWVLIIYISDGLVLTYPPHYNFEIYRPDGGLRVTSQALTTFFAIASLLALSTAFQSKSKLSGILSYWSAASFAFLSFLAGSRGEFLALLLCVVLLFTSGNLPRKLLSAFFFLVLLYGLTWGMQHLADDILVFERYRALFIEGDLSMRDILFSQSIDLLQTEARCTFFGCGFAFFQHYFEYDYGSYPHNSILEATITWGLPATLFLLACIVIGARKIQWTLPLPQVGLLSFLISLKSGDLMGGWLAMSFAFYLAGRGLGDVTMGATRKVVHRE